MYAYHSWRAGMNFSHWQPHSETKQKQVRSSAVLFRLHPHVQSVLTSLHSHLYSQIDSQSMLLCCFITASSSLGGALCKIWKCSQENIEYNIKTKQVLPTEGGVGVSSKNNQSHPLLLLQILLNRFYYTASQICCQGQMMLNLDFSVSIICTIHCTVFIHYLKHVSITHVCPLCAVSIQYVL